MITLESSLKFLLPVGIAILNLGTSGLVPKKKKKKNHPHLYIYKTETFENFTFFHISIN